MKPQLQILPLAQRQLWLQFSTLPETFTLYGGTAVALQLGHRESVDFDFFSGEPLDRNALLNALPFLKKAQLIQPELNTLNCFVNMPEGEVKLQFLAGLKDRQGQFSPPLQSEDNGIKIAALIDLLATKLNTIQFRAQTKDYLDIHAMLKSGLSLTEGLSASITVYGSHFDPGSSLRALCSYRDGDLSELPTAVQRYLITAARAVESIPSLR